MNFDECISLHAQLEKTWIEPNKQIKVKLTITICFSEKKKKNKTNKTLGELWINKVNFTSYHATAWLINCTDYNLSLAAQLRPKTGCTLRGTTCHVHPERSSDGLPSSSSDLTNPYDTAFPMPLGQVSAFPFPLQFLGCFTLGSARTSSHLLRLAKALPFSVNSVLPWCLQNTCWHRQTVCFSLNGPRQAQDVKTKPR